MQGWIAYFIGLGLLSVSFGFNLYLTQMRKLDERIYHKSYQKQGDEYTEQVKNFIRMGDGLKDTYEARYLKAVEEAEADVNAQLDEFKATYVHAVDERYKVAIKLATEALDEFNSELNEANQIIATLMLAFENRTDIDGAKQGDFDAQREINHHLLRQLNKAHAELTVQHAQLHTKEDEIEKLTAISDESLQDLLTKAAKSVLATDDLTAVVDATAEPKPEHSDD